MQMAAPEALDVEQEPESIKTLYGLDNPKCTHFSRQCLMPGGCRAGRAVRADLQRGNENEKKLDGHSNIARTTRSSPAKPTCRSGRCYPISSSAACWSRRWSSGTASSADCRWCRRGDGRDHNPHAFTTWLAGGGAKGAFRTARPTSWP